VCPAPIDELPWKSDASAVWINPEALRSSHGEPRSQNHWYDVPKGAGFFRALPCGRGLSWMVTERQRPVGSRTTGGHLKVIRACAAPGRQQLDAVTFRYKLLHILPYL
jgi:hypothetical protein